MSDERTAACLLFKMCSKFRLGGCGCTCEHFGIKKLYNYVQLCALRNNMCHNSEYGLLHCEGMFHAHPVQYLYVYPKDSHA